LLTRELLKAKGQIQSNEEFKYKISDFELGGGEEGEKPEVEGEHEVAPGGAAIEGGKAPKAAEEEEDEDEDEEEEEGGAEDGGKKGAESEDEDEEEE